MNVGTRNCSRPVWPPDASSTVEPVTKSGMLTVSLNPPSDVTRFLIVTPFGALSLWADTGAAAMAMPKSAATRTKDLTIMGVPPEECIAHGSGSALLTQHVTTPLGRRPSRAETSIRDFLVSRMTCLHRFACATSAALAMAVLPLGLVISSAAGVEVAPGLTVEVVVSGVPRPVQVALDGSRHLVILSHGRQGDAAAEIYRLEANALPVDASREPRVVIPFSADPRKAAFGSLAVDPRSGDLFLGEENGNRIYRLVGGKRLTAVAVGLNHLLGGSSVALDREGRLLMLDYASFESQLRSEAPLPPSLESLAVEDYTGPLVFRIDPEEDIPLPRRLDVVAPFFPRRPGRKVSGEPLHKFIAVAPLGGDELVLLNSVGEVLVLSAEGQLRRLARLPSGHFHRTNMTVGPDGSVFVSAGFHIRELYRVSPAGVVTSVAHDLGDPQGIVVDRWGDLYVAETALHRIIRIRLDP